MSREQSTYPFQLEQRNIGLQTPSISSQKINKEIFVRTRIIRKTFFQKVFTKQKNLQTVFRKLTSEYFCGKNFHKTRRTLKTIIRNNDP